MASSMGRDVAQRAAKLSTAISGGSEAVLRDAALKAKEVHLKSIAAVVGSDLTLSGVGQRGAKVGVSFLIARGNSPTALIRATGPLHLVEWDTSGRVIRSRYVRGRGRRGFIGPVAPGQFRGDRRAVLKMPDGEYRRWARHPGTSGQEPFAKGQERAQPIVTKEMRKRTTAIIRRAM